MTTVEFDEKSVNDLREELIVLPPVDTHVAVEKIKEFLEPRGFSISPESARKVARMAVISSEKFKKTLDRVVLLN